MIKTNNQSPAKTRKKFDKTFKREAVNDWLASGKSARASVTGSAMAGCLGDGDIGQCYNAE